MQEAWTLFPHLIEQKINGLLEQAEPNNTKAYQLYKACKNEQLWRNSFELFNVHLGDYYSVPKSNRAKSYFDNFLDRPMSRVIYDSFSLNFRTAQVSSMDLLSIADWSHNMIKNNCSTDSAVVSIDVFTRTLHFITSPPAYEKDQDIEFEDFCIAWKKIVFTLFGNRLDIEFEEILKEVRWLNKQRKMTELNYKNKHHSPHIYLTQTEIDWTSSVQVAAFENESAPKFPLSRGPDKEKLIHLERTVRLYNIISTSTRTEALEHQDKVRNTLLDQCSWLLKNQAS
ncbi:MAG: hypothetical protein AABY53_02635 [Bdellovibrionota bacterium]